MVRVARNYMRRAARVDNNQAEIVKALRKIPNVSVEHGHDDLLVGHKGITYWVEVKNPDRLRKDGSMHENVLQESQKKLKREWFGQYAIVSTLDEILALIGITK